jgi:Spy/CpxP family protein refolding chaperone
MAGLAVGQADEERYKQSIQFAKDAFITSLQQQLADAKRRYSAKHPTVIALEKELAHMQAWNPPATPFLLSKMSALPDQWWKDPEVGKALGLTSSQQKQLDDIFDQYRDGLINRNAALEKAEAELAALMAAGSKNDKEIIAAIDSVAQNRAELEKVRGRMLLAMRNQLTPEQWEKINRRPALTQR